jgi:hypothetical protein
MDVLCFATATRCRTFPPWSFKNSVARPEMKFLIVLYPGNAIAFSRGMFQRIISNAIQADRNMGMSQDDNQTVKGVQCVSHLLEGI